MHNMVSRWRLYDNREACRIIQNMVGSIRISIFAAGICALGLALLIVAAKPPFGTFFSLYAPSVDAPNKNEHALPAPADTRNLPNKTNDEPAPQTQTAETEQKTDNVLGTSPEKLKTAQEERVLVKEPIVSPLDNARRLPSQTLYILASERVVNLFCELPKNEVAIATGVIIHPRGYILTNAHVADTEQSRTCLIRRGSPARNFAVAERVFLPPNFSSKSHTRENLANDVAIWKITSVIEKETADTFPFFSIRPHKLPVDGAALATFSYPAELLGSHAVVSALYLSFSETKITAHDAYFIESAQGLGSQKGSSGGILLDPFTGELAGLIFAVNDVKTEYVSERTMFSLTPFAIQEAVRAATGKDLDAYLNSNP